ncbi:MAG: hypothetical protein AAF563_01750 [Pseudomonadota bacterium]
MADWTDLTTELDRWARADQRATFWWRDDDAGSDDERLKDFLDQRRRLEAPLALATVPAWLAAPTIRRVRADSGTSVLQHGWAHRNNARPPAKKTELVDGTENLEKDLQRGRETLQEAFDGQFQLVMVPPWNRIGPKIETRLATLGYSGLSTHGPRAATPEARVHTVNVHIDIIDWRARAFCGDTVALAQAISHLQARRTGQADALEPTGLMTHHRDHDAACEHFVDRFVTAIKDHEAGHWLDARSLFGARQEAA